MQSLFLFLIFLSCFSFAFEVNTGVRDSLCGQECKDCKRKTTGFGKDNQNYVYYCTECKSGYNLWEGKCRVGCAAGKFFSRGICYACDKQCATCTKGDACTSCSASYPLAYSGYCYQSCPPKTFKASSTSCQACGENCATCTNSLTCTVCQVFKFLHQNRCYATCPPGTYGDVDYKCKPCPDICATCSSPNLCLSCVAPNMLYNYHCLNPCPSGYYANGQVCSKCPVGCSVCSSATSCSTCQAGYYKKDNFCYATCPAGTYGDSNHQCLDCKAECSSCANPTSCLSCKSGYVFLGIQCVSDCPARKFELNGRCLDCMSSCQTCSSVRRCDTCRSPYIQIEDGYCTTSETSGSSCKDDITGCEFCRDSGTCLFCRDPDYYLYNNKCYHNSCPSKTFNRGYRCFACAVNCNACTNEATCTQCSSGLLLFQDNQCLSSCPLGYYSQNGKCQVCSTACADCSSASTCTQCSDDYFKNGASCVAACPAATYPILGVCQSCSAHCKTCGEGAICTECETNWMLLNNQCYNECPEGFYKEDNACQVCTDGCKNCTDASTCGACDYDYAFYQNTCLSRCPEGMYNATGFCKGCMTGCRICNSDIKCLQCAVGYVFLDHNCLTTCPDGYYNFDGICTSCPTGCTTCTSALLCQGCAFGYNMHETDVCALDISEKEVAAVKQMAKTAEATGTASSVVSSIYGFLNSGDPTAMFMGSLAKMLQYVKYINIDYPPKIKFMFGLQSNLNGTSEPIIKKVQKKIEDKSESPELGNNFGYYNLTSSFVSNCFQSLGTLAGIILGIGVMTLVLYWTVPSSKVHQLSNNLMGILKWNLFLLMFCGMVGDIVFFSSFEFRKAQFDNAFSVVSFVTCIFMNFLSIYVFYKLIQVNLNLHKSRNSSIARRNEADFMKDAESKWEGCKVFFHSYKNKKLSQQSFMIIFLIRVLSFYLIIAYFSAYPFFQIIMITLVSFFIVIYLIIIRPFKSRLNNVNQIVFEMIILAFNGCVLVLAALDTAKSENFATRKKLETILMNINLAAGFISTFFIVLKAIVLLFDVYKEWKLAKEAKNPRSIKLQKNRPTNDPLKINNNNILTTGPDSLFTHPDSFSQNIINLDTMTVTNMDQTYDMNNQSYDRSPINQNNVLIRNQMNRPRNKNQHQNILPSESSPSYGYQGENNQGYQRYNREYSQGYQQGNQEISMAELQSNNPRIKKSQTSTLPHKKIKKRPTYTSNVANQILRDGGHEMIVEENVSGIDLGNQTNEILSNPARLRRRQNRPDHNKNGIDMITL